MVSFDPREVRRKVYFFRLYAGEDEAGEEIPLNILPILRAVDELPFKDGERYVDNGDGNSTCAWVDNMGAVPKMRLSTIRKTDLPQLDRAKGDLERLNLGENGGLAETTHAIFFADNVVGVEYNHYGPRPNRVGWYLKKSVPVEAASIKDMRHLFRADVFEQLSKLSYVSRVELSAKPTYAATLAKANTSLGAIMGAAADLDGAARMAFSLSVEPRSKSKLAGLLSALKGLVKGKQIPLELVSKFNISGPNAETGKVEYVDLLSDYLVTETKMLRLEPDGRALSKESAYAGIQDAYKRLKADIESAVQVY